MNIKQILFYVPCLLLFWACEAGPNIDEKAYQDLESYVKSVEDTVEQGATVSWQEIESNYQILQRQVQQTLASTNQEGNADSQEELRKLEERYQESKRAYEVGENPDRSSSFDQYDNMNDTVLGSDGNQSEYVGDTLNRFP